MGTAITMYIAFIFLTTWIKPHWKRRAVGMGLVTDITVHVILQWMFGGDANGRAGLLLAGVMINATMHLYRRFYGYEKLDSQGRWTRYMGQRTTGEDLADCVDKPKAKRKSRTKTNPNTHVTRSTTARNAQARRRNVH